MASSRTVPKAVLRWIRDKEHVVENSLQGGRHSQRRRAVRTALLSCLSLPMCLSI